MVSRTNTEFVSPTTFKKHEHYMEETLDVNKKIDKFILDEVKREEDDIE